MNHLLQLKRVASDCIQSRRIYESVFHHLSPKAAPTFHQTTVWLSPASAETSSSRPCWQAPSKTWEQSQQFSLVAIRSQSRHSWPEAENPKIDSATSDLDKQSADGMHWFNKRIQETSVFRMSTHAMISTKITWSCQTQAQKSRWKRRKSQNQTIKRWALSKPAANNS